MYTSEALVEESGWKGEVMDSQGAVKGRKDGFWEAWGSSAPAEASHSTRLGSHTLSLMTPARMSLF